LFDGVAKNLVVAELPAHFDHQFGGRNYAGIGLRGSGRTEINAAVGIDDPLISVTGTLRRRTPIQRFSHAFSDGELLAGPRVIVADTSESGSRRREDKQERCAEAKGAGASN
jgi:hypothetical protein